MWKSPSVLSFDLDDTLYDNKEIIAKAQLYIVNLLGRNYLEGRVPTDENYSKRRSYFVSKFPSLKRDVSLLRFFVIKSYLLDFHYSNIKANIIAKELVDEFISKRSKICVSRETKEILSYLYQKYPLIAISNGNMDISQNELSFFFKRVYSANINNMAKPNSFLFDNAIYDFGIDAIKLCHIGDDEITDVSGSISAGALSIWKAPSNRMNQNLKILPHVEITSLKELGNLF